MTAFPAELSSTVIYAAEVGDEHVLAYKNYAKNLNNAPNIMILPIPGIGVTKDCMIDATRFRDVLKPYRNFARETRRARSLHAKSFDRLGVDCFDVGSYTVVLAEGEATSKDLVTSLSGIRSDRRPNFSSGLFNIISWIKNAYKDWPLAFCCWSGDVDAEPIIWKFKPRFEDKLWMPGVDVHDGGVPNLKAPVKRDHVLIFGSDRCLRKYQTDFSIDPSVPDEHKHLFVKNFVFDDLRASGTNGDFSVDLADVRNSEKNSFFQANVLQP